MMLGAALRRMMRALGAPVDAYGDMRKVAEEAVLQRQAIRQERVSRDLSETMKVPPFWRREERDDA